jgi:hypothetical protein
MAPRLDTATQRHMAIVSGLERIEVLLAPLHADQEARIRADERAKMRDEVEEANARVAVLTAALESLRRKPD